METIIAKLMSTLIGMLLAAGIPVSPVLMPQSMSTDTVAPSAPSSVTLPAATTTSSAYNWSGYVADSGTYTEVTGTWVVPTVSNPNGESADATWIGIGGVASRDLIQAGTEAVPSTRGSVTYQAWYELLPGSSHAVALPVQPGDSITASITEEGSNEWLINIHNNTTGDSYQTSVDYNSSLSSAEWIEEMPVGEDMQITLDDFGTVNFTSGFAIKNGESVSIASSGAQAVTMNNNQNEAVAIPSDLGSDGESFSVSRTGAEASALTLGPSRVRAIPETIPSSGQSISASSGGSYTITLRGGYGRTGRGIVRRIVYRF